MTTFPSSPLLLLTSAARGAVRIELRGDLDHHCADRLLDAATRALAEHAGLLDLHLDCAGLAAVDSSGLSALLMIRRRTDEAGVRLHLDEPPVMLTRMLTVTGTLKHLTRPETAQRGSATVRRPPTAGEESTSARSRRPDQHV
ncbi:hypothetical protein AMK16_20115 [Streptomyces sp. CB00455]|uniref:STAS domain-containing protein n=1 Tax=Streptomyces sp. CB00455 TaxID=1703927 RepID=UPI000939EEC7|nr:STAS domain-containing protein [Streptomyces sp. CB00455]OKK17208.1 hypothetical protein AMK16_20115 [Streptomyces sp. CB00455]